MDFKTGLEEKEKVDCGSVAGLSKDWFKNFLDGILGHWTIRKTSSPYQSTF